MCIIYTSEFWILLGMYQMNIPLLEEMHTRKLPVIKVEFPKNASGGEMYLSRAGLGSPHAYKQYY